MTIRYSRYTLAATGLVTALAVAAGSPAPAATAAPSAGPGMPGIPVGPVKPGVLPLSPIGPLLSAFSQLTGSAFGQSLWGDMTPTQSASTLTPSGEWSAALDPGSLYSLEASSGIQSAWARGNTGAGVTVAVIDTGIAPVTGLDTTARTAGGSAIAKVVNGPDLSFDSQADSTRYVDAFGHGTHLAGIIAGRDATWNPQKPSPAAFAGVAPNAQLLNVKVGAADGGADVSQVVAAINWVTQHRRDAGMNVRVISLAYGTESTQPWQVDPLAHAAESAWRAGIVVVTAAGNDGQSAPSLLMPAVDPQIIAVGAEDMQGTNTVADDTVADFSSGGSATRRPDVVAPGRSLVSLRVPGSFADVTSPGGRIQGDASGRFFRGSGTSQATAFVAGEVALLVGRRPGLTPDQVKALLLSTARPLARGNASQGAGVPDVTTAASAVVLPSLPLGHPAASSGTGSLELSRGGAHVVDPSTGVPLTGEVDILGHPWDAAAWAAATTAGTSWSGGSWNAGAWTGVGFNDSSWAFAPWIGLTWAGTPWSLYGQTGAEWVARSWRGADWEARSWREDSWLARSWRSQP